MRGVSIRHVRKPSKVAHYLIVNLCLVTGHKLLIFTMVLTFVLKVKLCETECVFPIHYLIYNIFVGELDRTCNKASQTGGT